MQKFYNLKQLLKRNRFTAMLLGGILCVGLFTDFSGGTAGYAAGGCGCHGPSSSATSIIVSGLPSGSTAYVPGATYAVTVSVSNALKNAAGIAAEVANGTFANLGPNLQLGNGPSDLTHSLPKSFMGGTFTDFTFDWIAPSTAGLPIDFQVSANAVDLTGGTNDDEWNSGVVFLPLEVDMKSFTVSPSANQVLLAWQTQDEFDMKQFIIERSVDGTQFENVGMTVATGVAGFSKDYVFVDKPKYTDKYYYRLCIVSKTNGQKRYSAIKTVQFDNGALFDFVAFPNPAKSGEQMSINLFNCKGANAIVEVLDNRGKLVVNNNYPIQNGTNYLTFRSELGPGIYTMRINDGKRKVVKKFVVR
ncbi:MAG: hypothetical protein RL660_3091 [Bacteroidota bacterium]|jgi:hypothetical protein